MIFIHKESNFKLEMQEIIENPNLPLTQSHINTLENTQIDLNSYYRPTELNLNTTGAYLWGCSQNYYGDVNKSCSPLCIGSLYQTESDCQYSIWIYHQNELVNKLNVKTSKAYIYVDENWQAFLNTDIEKLKVYGITHATILKTKNSQHKIVLPMTSIENLPIVKEFYNNYELKKENNYYWLIILFILTVILFWNFK